MADDKDPRSNRSGDRYARGGSQDQFGGGAGQGGDPLAELARLIGQHDPFAEFGRSAAPASTPGPRDQRAAPVANAPPPPDWRAPRGGDALPDFAPQQGNAPAADPRASFSADYAGPKAYRPPDRDGEPGFDDRYPDAPRADQGAYRDAPYRDERLDENMERSDDGRRAYDDEQGFGPRTGYDDEDPEEGGFGSGEYFDDDGDGRGRDDSMYDEAPPRRARGGLVTVAAVLGLAVVGTAGAFTYRSFVNGGSTSIPPVIRADTTPNKLVPVTQGGDPGSNKLIFDRVGDRGQNERMVSREEQPVQMNDGTRSGAPRVITSGPSSPGAPSGIPPNAAALTSAPPPGLGSEPRKVRTVTIRPDQPAGGDPFARGEQQPAAAPTRSIRAAATKPAPAPAQNASGPIALNAQGSAADAGTTAATPAAMRTASTAPAARTAKPAAAMPAAAAAAGDQAGGYFVQLSAQKSEDDAQASFRAMQGKFPNLLGSRQVVIRRKELGDKGTYYGAQVGPFASRVEANQLCDNLKTQGGTCLVQKN